MSVAARTAERVEARRAALLRVRLGAVHALAALVAASFAVRTVLGWLRPAPTLFADEYLYAELARSLAEHGRPLVRGASASFPALLQPILTAPAWLLEDVGASLRVVQTLGAAAMSLAAVPVFLLARRLGLGSRLALALAAFSLALPGMVYAGWVLAEPYAYPLALGAVAAGVAALARPRRRTQLVFLALAGLAVFARTQFAVLPLCFLAAALVVGLRERRLRAVLREQALVVALVLAPAAALAAFGLRRALGFYDVLLDLELGSTELVRWIGADLTVLVFACGVVLVPGALLGLALALARPRSREELAFGALAPLVVLALVAEAAVWGLQGERVQERYFVYAVPLLAVAFGLYASRGWPLRVPHALLAAGLVALAARVPLAGYSAGEGRTNSPTLMAVGRLESALGDVGLASFLVAAAATVLAGALALALWRVRRPTVLVLGLAFAAAVASSATVVVSGIENSSRSKRSVLGATPSLADATGLEGIVLLQSRSSDRGRGSAALFWNRSVEDVLLLDGAEAVDAFGATRLEVADDGTLLAGGEPVTAPLLADGLSDTLRFRSSEEVASGPVYRVLRSDGPHRLALLATGRGEDGWLGLLGRIQLWPEDPAAGLAGTLTLRLEAPPADDPAELLLTPGRGAPQSLELAPGESTVVELPVCSSGPWAVAFEGPATGGAGSRWVTVKSGEPVYAPDPSACR